MKTTLNLAVTRIVTLAATLAVVAPSTAQFVKYASTPAGSEFQAGNSANTFPMRGISASYQQIHDAADVGALNAFQSMIMSGMEFRPAQNYVIAARTFEVQITLSHTQVGAANMSATFASNLGTNTSVVLPYTVMSLPAGAGTGASPNPPLWKFPFRNIYIYNPTTANLCWDWRHKNSNAYTTTFMDFVSGGRLTTPITANRGVGCTATGRAAPAAANLTASASTLTASLTNGPASAPAFLALGTRRTPSSFLCGTLWFAPLIVLPGMTDASGTWTVGSFPSSVLTQGGYVQAFTQYGFADPGLPGGLGLSDLAIGASPANRGTHVSRVWSLGNTAGYETRTAGSINRNNGLVTMFTIL